MTDPLDNVSLGLQLQQLSFDDTPSFQILCDLGYGIPKEGRPRKEKILAIAKQLVNFIIWQTQTQAEKETAATSDTYSPLAPVVIVGCDDDTVQESLEQRMHDLWKQQEQQQQQQFPSHLTFADNDILNKLASADDKSSNTTSSVSTSSVVYLSPDAPHVLDISLPPPSTVIVGLLIDRRTIQVDKSHQRAKGLQIQARRWPMEDIVLQTTSTSETKTKTQTWVLDMDKNEPLNVDCVLEGMQQWYWNYYHYAYDQKPKVPNESSTQLLESTRARQCFVDAARQAIQHHHQRHPGRPKHKDTK